MSTRPRIRTIKPEMWQDEAFGTLSSHARLLFIGLITMADDEGRLRAMPSAIVGHVFPYDEMKPSKLKALLEEVANRGLIVQYEAQGVPYVCLPGWSKHQKINRPSPSVLPAPRGVRLSAVTEDSVNDHGAITEDSVSRARAHVGADRIGSDQERNPPSPPRGNRKTDLAAFDEQVRSYSEGLGLITDDGWRNVAGAIRNGATTTDEVLEFVGQWRPDLLPQNGAAA